MLQAIHNLVTTDWFWYLLIYNLLRKYAKAK